MTEIQDVTGAAFIVAEYRAWGSVEAGALYSDPIVPLFLVPPPPAPAKPAPITGAARRKTARRKAS